MSSRYSKKNERLIDELQELNRKSPKRMRRRREKIVQEYLTSPHFYTRQQISEMLDFSVHVISKDIDRLVKKGKLQRNNKGQLDVFAKTPYLAKELEVNKFKAIRSVEKWLDSLERSGSPPRTVRAHVVRLFTMCQTLDIHPHDFLNSADESDRLYHEFCRRLRDGDVAYLRKRPKDELRQSRIMCDGYLKTIKSFMNRSGVAIPIGVLKSETKTPSIFRNVKLNDSQVKAIVDVVEDEVFKKLFIIHHETGVRIDTLLNLKPIFTRKTTIIDGRECEYFIADIFEKKQGEVYQKVIMTPMGREIARKHVAGKTLHDCPESQIYVLHRAYITALRECYDYLGLIDLKKYESGEYDRKSKEYYFSNKPTHAIRHSSVHWLMRISGESISDVSSMFWDNPDTLKVYHKKSVDSFLQSDQCYVCNRPEHINKDELRFCSLSHALYYYNLDNPTLEKQYITRKYTKIEERQSDE